MAQENPLDPTLETDLHRSIDSRQLGMIAIGGAIGTGLFFASGGAIAQAGPGGAMLAYARHGLGGLLHDAVAGRDGDAAADSPAPSRPMRSASSIPRSPLPWAGITGSAGRSPGGRTGRRRPHRAVLVSAFEFRRSGPMGFFALLLALNLLSVRAYAEAEYWFAGIKVVTVIIFLAVGALMIAGMLGEPQRRLPELDAQRSRTRHPRALRRRDGPPCLAVFLVAGLFLPGHRRRGPRGGRDHRSAQERAQGDPHRVLAHPAVLHRRRSSWSAR